MDSPSRNAAQAGGMTAEEYALFRDLVYREFGIVLKGDKRMTLHTKLAHRLSILGLATYRDYYHLIISDASRDELHTFIAHITNNETYFLRESSQLNSFAKLLTDLKKQKQKQNRHAVKILSAGCSSGEEVYTLNLFLMESGLFAWGWDVRLIGMDVSRTAIEKARNAVYSKNSFRMMNGNDDFITRYFDEKDQRFALKKPYQGNVEFIQGNVLLPDALAGIDDIDVIFCRNILIYMDDTSIARVVANFYDHLADEGYLFIGLSESLLNKTDLFVPEYRDGVIVYRKNPAVAGR
jgi:chemotaxis protein methyltransferase CheR